MKRGAVRIENRGRRATSAGQLRSTPHIPDAHAECPRKNRVALNADLRKPVMLLSRSAMSYLYLGDDIMKS
jgi:hypothetical protein